MNAVAIDIAEAVKNELNSAPQGTFALGFQANWITEWCAYHPGVLERIGLKPSERIAGFIYVGQSAIALEDRPRPAIDSITTRF